jgi:stage V sporulation protein G
VEITDVRLFPIADEKLRAFVSIVLDGCFMVNDIKVIQGKDGLFISMPSRKKRNGEFKDVAHPLNQETRRLLEERILGEYRARLDGGAAAAAPARTAPATAGAESLAGQPTREEVERRHLNDAFWGVS